MVVWLGKNIVKHLEGRHAINPNGVDIGISEIQRIPLDSKAIIHGKQREVCKEKVELRGDYYVLEKGVYEVRLGTKVNMPRNCTGFLYPRSTFNRLGVIKAQTAVFDSGYSGFGTQTIYIPIKEIKIHKDEFWFQLVFISNEDLTDTVYEGHYQGETASEPTDP